MNGMRLEDSSLSEENKKIIAEKFYHKLEEIPFQVSELK